MIVAAIVGVAAAFAMQTAMSDGFEATELSGSTDSGSGDLKIELSNTERRLQSQIKELAANIEALTGNVEGLRTDIQNLKLQAPAAVSGSGETAAPVAAADFGEAINRVLDDRDKRREEEKDQEREQRSAEMRERFKGMMASRTDRFVKEKGWDVIQTDQVKQIMSDYMEKMSELGMMLGWRRGGGSEESREQVHQLMEETRTKLREIMPEEEVNKLLRGGGMGLGPGGRGAASK
jgi:uncharacterized protein YoxC